MKSAKLVVTSAKLVVKLGKLVVKTFKILVRLLGTVYPCAVPPYRSTDCTVPFFPLYRTSVHIVPYQCAQCTIPACPLYLCSLLYYTPPPQSAANRCVFSCRMRLAFISTVNLHVTPADRGEIVVFSHAKCTRASFPL